MTVVAPKKDPAKVARPELRESARLLQTWIQHGIDYRLATNPQFKERYFADEIGYLERVRHEFKVIADKDFCDYFLVTSDLIRWAKDVAKMGVGPGRGSAAGSLLCYLIRITEIDPMQFPLMQFERFIDPSRPDMPDIDIDFARPIEVFRHAEELYGAGYVAHIGNFMRYRGRTAVKDIARVIQMPFKDEADFKALIADRPDGDPRENDSILDTIDAFPAAREIYERYEDIGMRIAPKLEGNLRGLGVHAAGMVISNTPITDICAVYSKENSEGETVEVIAYDKRDAERQGMLKLDALGLTTMQIAEDVIEMVPELTFEQFYAMPLDDPKVLTAFVKADLTGIFQFEGRTTKSIVQKVFKNSKPRKVNGSNFTDGLHEIDFLTLADINALSRPGSLISGMTARYEKISQGEAEPRDYGYDAVNEIMKDTLGCLVYQEQVMAMGRAAGMPGDRVGALRRIIGKKKAGGAFDEFWAEFRDGMAEHQGMPEEEAKELWDFMAASSSYLFNIAHAVSYAVIAYWAMWMKVYYPTEFYAASLRYAKKTKDKDPALALMQDALRHNVNVHAPDIYQSDKTWRVLSERNIRAGFMQFHGIGERVADNILEYRREMGWERPESGGINFDALGIGWKDLLYVGPKYSTKKVPAEPYLFHGHKYVKDADGDFIMGEDGKRLREPYTEERDWVIEKTLRTPAKGVSGCGPKMVESMIAFAEADDPFNIHYAAQAVDTVRNYLLAGELDPLYPVTADAHDLQLPTYTDQEVIFAGLVKEVRYIDVIDDMRKRENRSADDIRAELDDPHLSTKAKVICIDEHGMDVHVNVSRYQYPKLQDELTAITVGTDVAYVVGKCREGFGPTIQAKTVIAIDPTED
jgi:DNA polymerase-3 subunit alpha